MTKVVFVMDDDSTEDHYIDCRQTVQTFINSEDKPKGWKYCRVKLRGKWFTIHKRPSIKVNA